MIFHKNKKSAVEMSISLIIMLVIGLVILGLIISFVTGFLGNAQGNLGLNNDDKNQIDQIKNSPEDFELVPTSLPIKRGKIGKVYLGLFNSLNDEEPICGNMNTSTTGISVSECLNVSLSTSIVGADIDSTLILSIPPFSVTYGSKEAIPIAIEAKRNAKTGVYFLTAKLDDSNIDVSPLTATIIIE